MKRAAGWSLWCLAKRFLQVLAAWWLIGIATGICMAPRPDLIGFIGGGIAGLIVASVFGLFGALIGSHVNATLFGAAAGAALMMGMSLALAVPAPSHLALGLITGGLIGSTFSSFLHIRNWAVSLLRQQGY
jgi:hypothetical protein